MKCRVCKQEIIFHLNLINPDIELTEEEKKIQGTVYSLEGLYEVTHTGICEACFDRITKAPDEDYDYSDDYKDEENGYL